MAAHLTALLVLCATSLAASLVATPDTALCTSTKSVERRDVANCASCHARGLVAGDDAQVQGKNATEPDPRAAFFEAKIRPVLVARCEECHAETADGGLRLDSADALSKGGDSGLAVAPGDPDGSLLIQAVRHSHAKLKMPKRRAKLAQDEIDALVQWVRDGAYWPEGSSAAKTAEHDTTRTITAEQRAFWSFLPLAKPAVPTVQNRSWPQNDIDRFVLAKMEREGLAPVASANRRTLIRRATLDLTGIPPTPEEVEAFAADSGADAFAKVIDRLLDSPHYGETWGRWWLDVARFAEDDCRSLDPEGRGFNPYPNAYLYRDWAVQAFNDDMTYDMFVRAQIAGDLLDESTRARILPALGFLGLGPWYYDNGSVEVTRADERNDRVDAVTRGFLGLTVACARCHDHKYDPIATEDFYALAGVFQNTAYHEYPQVPQAVVDEYKEKDKRIESKETLLRDFLRTEARQLSETLALQSAKYMRAAWKVLGEPKKNKASVAADEKLDYELFDRWLAFLAKPPKHYPHLEAWQAMLAQKGSKQEAAKLADQFQTQLLDVMFAHKELEEENDVIRAKALIGTKKKKRANLPNEFVTYDDFCPGCGLELKSLPIEQQNLWTDAFQRDLDSTFDITGSSDEEPKVGLFAFDGFGLERQLGADRRAYLDELRKDVKSARAALGPKYPYVHGVEDAALPTAIRVHVRGSPFKLGDEVPRRFPAVLCAENALPFAHGSGRLDLAEAIVAHPITARVIVNRVWKGHFGTGIVDTPSNLGKNGERPTNPELLEYLASKFVESGMSLKALHRSMMLTSVYQLSAADSEGNAKQDSGNRSYWRANEKRMTAEQLRDSSLFVSGALDMKMGGPSEKLRPLGKRRTIYAHVSRYRLDEFLALFDFPAPSSSSERRFTTHVPLQRLFFMNSDFIQQQGELLARRVASESDDTGRIQKLYALLYGRAATEDEVRAGLAYLASEPMTQYEERRSARLVKEAAEKDGDGGEKTQEKADKAADLDAEMPTGEAQAAAPGMMAGVVTDGADPKKEDKLLSVSVWGRYAKVLLGSSEFIFIR